MSGPGGLPFGDGNFLQQADGWRPDAPSPEPWPKGAVGTHTLPDGGSVPIYYCLFCEEKSAVEGRPTMPEHLKKYGANATIHACFKCEFVREVAYPADAKGDA